MEAKNEDIVGQPLPPSANASDLAPSSKSPSQTLTSEVELAASQNLCLKWNDYQSNLTAVFDQLLQNESFVDVTISTEEGHSLKCHKVVLSACSPYFQKLFSENPCPHPIVILKDTHPDDLRAVVDYMYKGEVNVTQGQLEGILRTAEALQVRGMTNEESCEMAPASQPQDLRPHKKRKLSLDTTGAETNGGSASKLKTRDDIFEDAAEKKPRPAAASGLFGRLPSPPLPLPYPLGHPARMQPHSLDESIPRSNGKPPLDDLSDVKPGILEMIQEEQRVSVII